MKATLVFNLPKEQYDFNCASHGSDYRCAIEDIREAIRQWKKYDGRETVTIEEVENMFWGCLKERDLTLD